jgi:hypothetical protein
MFVPNFPQSQPLDESGNFVQEWRDYFQLIGQNLQLAIGNEGYAIPQQTTTNIAIIQPSAAIGTLLFDESAVNGGTIDAPNGQLYVKLADGTFHPVTNT